MLIRERIGEWLMVIGSRPLFIAGLLTSLVIAGENCGSETVEFTGGTAGTAGEGGSGGETTTGGDGGTGGTGATGGGGSGGTTSSTTTTGGTGGAGAAGGTGGTGGSAPYPGPVGAPCDADEDCAGSPVGTCWLQWLLAPSKPAAVGMCITLCDVNADCEPGQACFGGGEGNGKCVPLCGLDSDCYAPFTCVHFAGETYACTTVSPGSQ